MSEQSKALSRCAGYRRQARHQGSDATWKPQGVGSDAQPNCRWAPWVAERFVVPLTGNAGGGKGPQFKTDAISGDVEIGQPINSEECSGKILQKAFSSAKAKAETRSLYVQREDQPRGHLWFMPMPSAVK